VQGLARKGPEAGQQSVQPPYDPDNPGGLAMQPDRTLEIGGQTWAVIDDEKYCLTALYPLEAGDHGPSFDELAERYGDDIVALLQSAAFYVIGPDDGAGNWMLESTGHVPWLATAAGQIERAPDGAVFEPDDGSHYVASSGSWREMCREPALTLQLRLRSADRDLLRQLAAERGMEPGEYSAALIRRVLRARGRASKSADLLCGIFGPPTFGINI
jgi:hypothetical protein